MTVFLEILAIARPRRGCSSVQERAEGQECAPPIPLNPIAYVICWLDPVTVSRDVGSAAVEVCRFLTSISLYFSQLYDS